MKKKSVSERTIITTEKALLFGPPEDHESPSSLPVKCSYLFQVSWSVLYSHQDHPLNFFSNFALNRRLQSLHLPLKTTHQRNFFRSNLKLQTRCFKSFRKLSQNLSPSPSPSLHLSIIYPDKEVFLVLFGPSTLYQTSLFQRSTSVVTLPPRHQQLLANSTPGRRLLVLPV